MQSYLSEDDIEVAITQVFIKNLGYRHLNCINVDLTGRKSESDVVIRSILQKRLADINFSLPASAIDEAVEVLCTNHNDKTALAANKEIYGHIRNGIELTVNNKQGKREPVTIKVIDTNPKLNDYLNVTQLWIQGKQRLRPDIIVYINGLPLVFIELKNSKYGVRNAYDDNLRRYKDHIPLLFQYNAICILSNGLETKVGGFSSGYGHFFPWLRPENEKQEVDKKRIKEFGVSLDYAVLGLCEKHRILDYLENFILYYNDDKKIIAKNHQFLGVNNAVTHFEERIKHDREGTDEDNKGKLSVFWHTQGSGKSFSMIFFTQKIFRKETGNFTFLIVTDRDDLDGQIYRNFLGAGAFHKSQKCQPKNSEDLRAMLQTNTRYVFTLIQKFRYDKGKKYPILSTRNDIIVIIDEAHRTQYKDLADNMRAGLPNAQYIAFTGTPLLGSKQLTENWFGKTVSEYNFKQSIEDGATVPLFYNKRKPEVCLQNDDLDSDLADIVEDEELSEASQQRLVGDLAQEVSVIKSDDRLETIAQDIVYHFPRRGYLGKGMVICFDKFTAVKMYNKVMRLWAVEKRNIQKELKDAKTKKEIEELKFTQEWMRRADMAVVVSEEAGEEEKFRKEGLDIVPHRKRMNDVDDNGLDIEDNFKDKNNPLQLVFVCSMWLTGFDVETISTLYLDKPMKDHTLMQAIARANRVTDFPINGKSKKNGLIVDYYGVFGNLKKAFASYGGGKMGENGEEGEDTPAQEKKYLFVLLQDAINECDEFCKSIGVDLKAIGVSHIVFNKLGLFDDYANAIMANDAWKKQFIVYDNTVYSLYESCKPEINKLRDSYKYATIIRYLREVIDGNAERADLDSAKRKISLLLDESIIAQKKGKDAEKRYQYGQVAEADSSAEEGKYMIKAWKQIDLSKFDVDKLKEEYKVAPHKNIEINDFRAFIEMKLQQMVDRNVTRINFAQRIQEIIDRYNSTTPDADSYFDELMEFMEKMKEEEQRAARAGLTESELEIFDLIKKENLTKKEEEKAKNAAKHLLKRLREDKPTVLIHDWYKDNQTRIVVKDAIQRVLDVELPDTYDRSVFNAKCDSVYDHLYKQAIDDRAVA